MWLQQSPSWLRWILIAAFFATGCSQTAATPKTIETEHYTINTINVADGLSYPWGLAFLPDGTMIVSERVGALRLVTPDGTVQPPLTGVPRVAAVGQGGMLDVALDPNFTASEQIFFSYSEAADGGYGTAVASARLDIDGNRLVDVKVIFRQLPKSRGGVHFGSRLVFANDGTLFITIGDRGQRDQVQDFQINRGQVIRVNKDGSIPDDNPFVGAAGYRPEVWSYGHRNPQGAALHPTTGDIWTSEHGPAGGDEINLPRRGGNHGWPVIGYGRHYSGNQIGVGHSQQGLEQPAYYWDPSIAPAGMSFYRGDKFPKWRDSLFVGALKYQLVSRLSLKGNDVVGEERILQELDVRIRNVQEGPDGYLYILTDSRNGQIIRLEPAP